MKMETSSSYKARVSLPALLFWLGWASISLLFFVSGNFSTFARFTVPMAELQRKVVSGSNREVRAVTSSEAQGIVQFQLSNRFRNGTVIVSPISSEAQGIVQFQRSNRFRNGTVIKKVTKLSKHEQLEQGLARARVSIRKAALSSRNLSAIINATERNRTGVVIYRNPGAFYQSYAEMERRLKVYVYKEGEPPMTHEGPWKDIYSIEGRFISEMEHGAAGGRFRTWDPDQAHVYFMPFSVTWMVKYLYTPLSYNLAPLRQFVSDYVTAVSANYPFWNASRGANHFMLACHDWGPHASRGHPQLYNTSIRVLCNANSSEGFTPQKDVSLPEIHLYAGKPPPILSSPPPPTTTTRPYLAFFAGGLHGPIRPILLRHWQNRHPALPVFEYLPGASTNRSRSRSGPVPDRYYSFLLRSKFCLCPSGHEVASPRIVEAIYAACVPVILSDHYVLPFDDVLRWEAFSVRVEVRDIPRLKEILEAIGEDEYGRLVEGVRAVRKHFVINDRAERFVGKHTGKHGNVRIGEHFVANPPRRRSH